MINRRQAVSTIAFRPALGASLAAGLLLAACGGGGDAPPAADSAAEQEGVMTFSISSDAFGPDEAIPTRFTCDGQDTSPALAWGKVPDGTQSLALIVDDPDAPRGVFTHWVLYDLAAEAQGLPEGVAKAERPDSGGIQGSNDFGNIGYGGPCPPPGSPHRYRFVLYALDGVLGLEPGASKQQVLSAMEGRILGEARLVGTYERQG